nr:M81 family metallopeptidase [Brucella anthropi]
MRLVIARLNHETNTFSPVATPLASFDPQWGEAALAFGRGSNTALGAFIAYATKIKAEMVIPLAATANPSGTVDDDAFETMAGAIVAAVARGCDAVLLDLHGAMVTKSHDDGEGELLARIRQVAPSTPIGVALDMHGNITPAIIVNSDCIVGFKTYPHVDMYATGEHVVRIMDAMLERGMRPYQVMCHPPMLASTLCMNTNNDCAMTDLVDLARQAERRDGVLAVTVFGGFPIADIAETGLSVVVVANEPAVGQEVATDIAQAAWQRREELVYREEPLQDSLARAVKAASSPGTGPVLLLDHGDNCMSGGTCDNVDVLRSALARGMAGIVAGPICDPETVRQLTEAGVGAQMKIDLGNRLQAEGFDRMEPPLRLFGRVGAVSDGQYIVSGPIYTGQVCRMGKAVKFVTADAIILITERPHEPWDLGVFTSTDIDPLAARFLILKSRMYCRPVFEPLSRATIECASFGVTSSNFDNYSFTRLARPIYPLDPQTGFDR